jgi:hypothetical protein
VTMRVRGFAVATASSALRPLLLRGVFPKGLYTPAARTRAGSSRARARPKHTEEDELRRHYSPALSLGVEDTVFRILEALRNNNEPYYDFGVEVLYRFSGAHCAPFGPSTFFGRPLDLGQFERFRRVMNTEKLRVLIGHTDVEVLSRLDLSERKAKVRVKTANAYTKLEGVFEFTLERGAFMYSRLDDGG